ncbi:hypothetical protein H6G54_14565 [Anabaena cylindrica FACHB-243]|uniref:HEAT repeat domain-containing protein n=1 Tax=Anabaena cylindrica (strain ATCC 27899 / PCC 7122) TaxID=272123 RepID=K9ZME8_ANACC|nr:MULTISPECIES: hypothetical protein [Anabaena]AFZ60376.1 hypothetical protein Anacy_5036 [Anabaena cylindrica PCC 7122]MBD2418901.1 hypothetical protein [Anabaena cylindrica FACHB-243]MBY5284877.1 hypothetical protein [Anabaena sp. CCAP 1446/1C]MBY5309484.1 hypothetical protein [Anabaena sp. CCAP 1446/1C]MCM2404490.1 hypothetical protein [Anabaena sp. CCAP 1446/1C]
MNTKKYASASQIEEEKLYKENKFLNDINGSFYSKIQVNKDVKAKKNNPQPNIDRERNYYAGEFIGLILIKDYFQEHPNKRKALAKNVAQYITSTDTVLEVLDLGTSRKIREGFDATVMLLAECGNVIISTLNHLHKPDLDNKDLLVLEEKWEILITSIACTSNIPVQKRFNAIVKLIPDSNRRSVKAAIIDALLIMEDEIDIQAIKSQLEYFLSDSEHDEYVKEYAKEALEDM